MAKKNKWDSDRNVELIIREARLDFMKVDIRKLREQSKFRRSKQ